MASLNGWGRSTWGNAAWGSPGTLDVTGVEAAGAIGSETVVIVQTIAVTGVEATGSTGNIIFQADLITGWGRSTWGSGVWGDAAVVLETGVEAASAIGSSTVVIPVSLSVTGVEAASAIGTPSVGTFVTISATGVSAASAIGTVTASGKSFFSVTGVLASGAIGTVGKGTEFIVTGVETQLGCVIHAAAAELFEKRVYAAVEQGAKVLYDPGRVGALLPPIVVDHVPHDSALVFEETFGPIIPIVRVPDDDIELMKISNSTPFGLSAGVCTNDLNRIIAYINGLHVGTVNIWEQPGYRIEMSPFGGIKDSGNGVKEGVLEAMKFFTNVKTYSLPWPR